MMKQKKSMWKPEEDMLLKKYVQTYGEGKWSAIPKKLGLMRDGKSCRLRWKNYLRPDIKHGSMSKDEQDLIIRMHKLIGNRWSLIAGRLPGRTDNEVKNYWNTHLSKNPSTKRKTITCSVEDETNPESKKPKVADFDQSSTDETLKIISIGEDQYNLINASQSESRDEEERWSSLTEEMLMSRSGAGSLGNGLMEMGSMYGEDDEDLAWASAAWDHASCVLLDTFGREFGLPHM